MPSHHDKSWAEHIQPALDILFRSPEVIDPDSGASSIPRLSAKQYADAYSAIFGRVAPRPAMGRRSDRAQDRMEVLYMRFNNYCADVCKETIDAVCSTESLIASYVRAYDRYTSALSVACRLFAFVERHWVKRERDEGRGWFKYGVVGGNVTPASRRRAALAKHWGLSENATKKEEADVELKAEIASAPECIVSLYATGLRRWRLDVVEPLLAQGERESRKERRFLDAVVCLLDENSGDAASRLPLLEGLAASLASVGVAEDDPIRGKLTEVVP